MAPTWLATALLAATAVAACGPRHASTAPANATPYVPRPETVAVPQFGDVSVIDGELAVMDRATGDARVHVLAVYADGRAETTSWADRAGPRADERTEPFLISDDERRNAIDWARELWDAAPTGRHSFSRPPPDGKPAYAWAVVLRRGDEVRVLDGGASSGPDRQPEILESVVDYLDMHF